MRTPWAIVLCSSLALAQSWTATDTLAVPRASFRGNVLNDGTIYVSGGYAPVTAAAELYGSVGPVWLRVRDLPFYRFNQTQTVLPNGRVFIVGGEWGAYLEDTYSYDALADTYAARASLDAGRTKHSAILLDTGRVLVAGGQLTSGPTTSCLLYDPMNDTWTTTGSLSVARYSSAIALLGDGRVLLTGGRTTSTILADVEVYDPLSATWTVAPSLRMARESHTAHVLPDGTVMVVGNQPYDPGASELWNPRDDAGWRELPMAIQHFAPFTAVIDGGRVVVAGGYANDAGSHGITEIWEPSTQRWYRAAPMPTPRYYGVSALLPRGVLLGIGGQNDTSVLGTSELFIADPFDAGFDAGIPALDAGRDGGTSDAGTSDAGASDAGTSDAGTSDAGTSDAGTSDAGVIDAGMLDAGVLDAGVLDAGVRDAGVRDAGVLDGGPSDAGESDGGRPSERMLTVGCGCSQFDALLVCGLLLLARRARASR